MKIWEKYKSIPILRHIDIRKIPCTILNINEENAKIFNKIIKALEAEKDYSKIIRTNKGHISTTTQLPAYDVRHDIRSVVELTILDLSGMRRIQFRTAYTLDKENNISGRNAYFRFYNVCLKHGIDLNDYAIENGEEVKKSIPSPIIKLYQENLFANKTLENVHHLDFNSSHLSGLVKNHPEFYDPVNEIYQRRKDEVINKAVLTHSFGFMQSKLSGYRWAHLSKIMLEHTNSQIINMYDRLLKNGRLPILANTDGIWYFGNIYHGKGEGSELMQWKNDHINCIFRAKSAGAYEYIEDGKYHPVIRGQTKYDAVVPRDEWNWGDIYRDEVEDVIIFKWENNRIRFRNGIEVI